MRSVLVLRGGALGDFIVTLPTLAALRARWPEARIELVGNATAAALAVKRGLLDAAHSQHDARWSALFGTAPLSEALASWLGEFDLVMNYWPDPDGELRRRFPVRAGQAFLSAGAMPARAPAALHYAEPLGQFGLEVKTPWVPLAAPATDARTIALHPGSGSPRKNWPLERWIEVARALPAPALVILGEAERAQAAAFRALPNVRLAERLPLEELVREFMTCRLFLGHDSGVSHLAAACGVPSVLLFGPTDPAMWAPPAPHVRVIRRGAGMETITVRDVLERLGGSAVL
jgi:ADP-heptose:LPS heptosyltransferase